MTTRRKLILWGWIAALIVMSLWPPWISAGKYPRGYAPIFSPPQTYAWADFYGHRILSPQMDSRIDFRRLMPQYLVVTLIAGGLYFAWPFRPKGK